jgi:hypothetical protein
MGGELDDRGTTCHRKSLIPWMLSMSSTDDVRPQRPMHRVGKVVAAILDGVRSMSAPSTLDLACHAFDVADPADLTAAQVSSTQRALRQLKARGELTRARGAYRGLRGSATCRRKPLKK